MLRQIKWWVQNGPSKNNWVLLVTTFFFENFVSVWEPLKKTGFDEPATQMFIFLLFVSGGVFIEGAFPCGYH